MGRTKPRIRDEYPYGLWREWIAHPEQEVDTR